MASVLGRSLGSREFVDHINFDKLDCRRVNLRIVTPRQNLRHRRPRNATGYRGVHWHKASGKWAAGVKSDQRYYHCGLYTTPEAAAVAAYAKRRELGFPDELPLAFAAVVVNTSTFT